MDNKEPAPQELHGEGLAPNTPSAAPIPAAAAPDPALCCGKFVACENIYCVWKIQALRKPAAPSGVVVPREPTIIKAFPGQAVEEYRQQHGGFLPAEAEKWDTLLGKLPTDGTPQNKELTIAGNLVRQVILDFKRAMLAAAPSQSAAVESSPVDMLLWCPKCGTQHVDAPDDHAPNCGIHHYADDLAECDCNRWTNPPHATHACKSCGLNWRPSNVLTNGAQNLPAQESKHIERMAAADPGCYAPAEGNAENLKLANKIREDAFLDIGNQLNDGIGLFAIALKRGQWRQIANALERSGERKESK